MKLKALIQEDHSFMEETFLLHQEALLEKNLPLALQLLTLFEQQISHHILFENNHLLPLHQECVTEPRWGSHVYEAEHKKIISLLRGIQQQLQTLINSSFDRRDIIELLDQEKTLKGVIEHHEEREESALLPELEVCAGAVLSSVCETFYKGLGEFLSVVKTQLDVAYGQLPQ